MDVSRLLQHGDVLAVEKLLRELAPKVLASNRLRVKCKMNYKYVNLVLQGGGTLGIAHVGMIHALEACRIRFAGVAGTSAGAIVSLVMAAARSSWDEPCAATLLRLLASMPTDEFVDGPSDVRMLVKAILAGEKSRLALAIAGLETTHRLLTQRGINPGNTFLRWLRKSLSNEYGVSDLAGLQEKLRNNPRLDCPNEQGRQSLLLAASSNLVDGQSIGQRLRIVATGLPLGLKFVFPQDSELVDCEDGPASFARASMSIPFFFDPYQLRVTKTWRDLVAFDNKTHSPYLSALERASLATVDHISFVDGGVLSNFPIDIFVAPSLTDQIGASSTRKANRLDQNLLTLGISMTDIEDHPYDDPHDSLLWNKGAGGFAAFLGQIVQGMRFIRDREARSSAREDFAFLADIPTGPHNWLNFMLDEADQRDLFVRGLKAGQRLVERIVN